MDFMPAHRKQIHAQRLGFEKEFAKRLNRVAVQRGELGFCRSSRDNAWISATAPTSELTSIQETKTVSPSTASMIDAISM
jgi:hypothetical protein